MIPFLFLSSLLYGADLIFGTGECGRILACFEGMGSPARPVVVLDGNKGALKESGHFVTMDGKF